MLQSWESRDLCRGMEQGAPAALSDLPACSWHLNSPCPWIRNPVPLCKYKMSSCNCQGYDYVKRQQPFPDLHALYAKERASIVCAHILAGSWCRWMLSAQKRHGKLVFSFTKIITGQRMEAKSLLQGQRDVPVHQGACQLFLGTSSWQGEGLTSAQRRLAVRQCHVWVVCSCLL